MWGDCVDSREYVEAKRYNDPSPAAHTPSLRMPNEDKISDPPKDSLHRLVRFLL
jgi:hypothetical protein